MRAAMTAKRRLSMALEPVAKMGTGSEFRGACPHFCNSPLDWSGHAAASEAAVGGSAIANVKMRRFHLVAPAVVAFHGCFQDPAGQERPFNRVGTDAGLEEFFDVRN